MPLILHHKDPSRIIKHDVHNVANDTNFLSWIRSQWLSSEEMAAGLSVTILLNGRSIFESDADDADESVLDITISGNDVISIINRPALIGIIVVVAIVVAVAISLALAPSLPGNAGEQSESPNNRLQAARNAFRPGEARPEIFGSIISYPDFIQPTFFEYVGNLKIVYELGYVGEGYFDIGEVRSGETPFNSIPGSSFQIFQPGAVIPQTLLTIHRPADPVDGQSLLAPDDDSLQQVGEIDTITPGASLVLRLIANSTMAIDMGLLIGSYLTLGTLKDSFGQIIPIGTYQVSGLALVTGRTEITLNTTDTIVPAPSSIIAGVTGADGKTQNYVGYFDIPGTTATEIWFNWQMPQGIRTENGGELAINLEFQIERLTTNGIPTGEVITKLYTISGNTINSQFRTTKFTPAEFPSMIASQYRARVRRTSIRAAGSAAQQIKMEQFISVTNYTGLDNSTGTVISWQRRATTFAVGASGNKNNLDVTRRLPVYNRVTGVYDVNTLAATRSFADAAAYTLVVASGRDVATVDMAELYGIYDGLLHAELGYFDFTFDSKNVGLGERIESICNVARVNAFRDGAIWRFTRDEIKPIRTAMFNRRVTVGNRSKQSWLLQRPDDKDSVALTYVDPVSNTERILYRRVDSNGDIVSDGEGRQALEITLAGCKDFFQAWNRVNMEMRRIIYQRRTVTDKTLRDGMTVGLLERVGWVDPNDSTAFSGEILGFNVNVFDTSERFEPVASESYVVYITDNEGNPSNTVTATARTDTDFGFIAAGLSGAYLADPSGDQLGSRYFIGSVSDIEASDFMVTSRKPQANGSVDIELVEYVPQMYEMDTSNPPQNAVKLPRNIESVAATSIPDAAVSVISVNTNGTVTATGGFSTDYVNPPAAGIGSNFEAKMTQISGEPILGLQLGVWLPVTSDLSWMITKDGATNGTLTSSATLEIRDSSFVENTKSTATTLLSVVGGIVELPATILVAATAEGSNPTAEIRFLSNGQYEGVGTPSFTGNYVTTAPSIGSSYEIMATLQSGTAPVGSAFGVWINLGGAGASWTRTSASGEAVLNVQIRKVATPANTDSSVVTLRTTREF